VVPFTRGRLRSRPASAILEDVKKLVDRGVKEVTLLGQNVNSYMGECGTNFSQLLVLLAEKSNILRIRYTTSHPKDFTEELCQVHRDYKEKICDYIHLPVQSGNSEVLHRMNRVYTREDYLKKIEMIYKYVPSVSLSSDFIVGFPGETEEQFLDTLSLIQDVKYESLYAFKYSPRPFTKAARFGDQVPEEVMQDRLDRLLQLHRTLSFKECQKYVGDIVEVLVDKSDSKGSVSGRSSQNKITHFQGSEELIGQIVKVRIEKSHPQTLHGVRVY
jgi:tRNA-2-methylthio-N6-dimethylallyladenosine synthase